MNPTLTVKSQVTVPKDIQRFLGIDPGERITFEPMPDGRVVIAPAEPRKVKAEDPVERMKGSGKRGPREQKPALCQVFSLAPMPRREAGTC